MADDPPTPEDAEAPSDDQSKWRVTIYEAWCKGCGICVAFCPKDVYEQDILDRPQIVQPARCTGCQKCVLHCPDFAISVDASPDEPEEGS